MDYIKLGRSGLEVSRICLGCMTYADPAKGSHSWIFDEADSRPFFRHALDLGINFFDTANAYSLGASEEVLGRAIKDLVPREEVVIATKVYNRMRPGPNGAGLSRKAIMAEIDASLKRLGTDYVDLYVIHRFDYATPIEETMEALHDVVKAGKTRYLGASSMWAWQLMKMQGVAATHGWTRFIAMQNHINLLYREEEREMMPLCLSEGVGVFPWSPLARGRLTRRWSEAPPTPRAAADKYTPALYKGTDAADRLVVEALCDLADERGVPPAQIALAWLYQKPGIVAPVMGASRLEHLDAAADALSVELSAEEVARLEAPYVPHAVIGFE